MEVFFFLHRRCLSCFVIFFYFILFFLNCLLISSVYLGLTRTVRDLNLAAKFLLLEAANRVVSIETVVENVS